MPYLHRFGTEDKFINRMTTHPHYEVMMFSGSAYVNNRRFQGSDIPTGSVSLYEMNVDRSGKGFSLIYPFMIKGESFWTFNNITTTEFNEALAGTTLTGSAPLTASLQRDLIAAAALPSEDVVGSSDAYVNARKNMIALRNTMDYYRKLSNAYQYKDNYVTGDVNMISIPSIFFDSGIKKGTVSLKFYFSGTLMDEAKDENQNGELISTRGATSGSILGVVLYNEGFVLLTSSVTIDAYNSDVYEFDGTQISPSWKYFGAYTGASTPPSSSVYSISFKGTNTVPTMMMFATLPEGEARNSQNPSWILASSGSWRDPVSGSVILTSASYAESKLTEIKNTVQSQYCRFEDEFQKQTFVSRIGLFDRDRNLVAMAMLPNPVLKKQDDAYTFKLKLDF